MSSWDDDDYDVEKVVPPSAKPKKEPKAAAKPKPKPAEKPKVAPQDMPLADKEQEMLRQRRLQEESDMALAGDLFGASKPKAAGGDDDLDLFAEEEGDDIEIRYEITDKFNDFELDGAVAVDNFAKDCSTKIKEAANLHSVATNSIESKFLIELLKDLTPKIKIAECEALQKEIMKLLKEKKKVAASKASDKALGGKHSNLKKNAKIDFQAEWDDYFVGARDGDDEEWEEEKPDAAAPAAVPAGGYPAK